MPRPALLTIAVCAVFVAIAPAQAAAPPQQPAPGQEFYAALNLTADGISGKQGLIGTPRRSGGCYWTFDVPCAIKGTLKLSRRSQRKLGLRQATISRFGLSFPGSVRQDANGGKVTRYTLGLSEVTERRLKRARSVRMTLSVRYSRGGPFRPLGSKTFTLTQSRLVGDKSHGKGRIDISNAGDDG